MNTPLSLFDRLADAAPSLWPDAVRSIGGAEVPLTPFMLAMMLAFTWSSRPKIVAREGIVATSRPSASPRSLTPAPHHLERNRRR